MVPLCAARFDASPQKILIDATWTNAPLSPANSAPTCVLLALDGSLRLATAGAIAANRSIIESGVECGGAGAGQSRDNPLAGPDEVVPVSQFEFNSSLSTDVEGNGLCLLSYVFLTFGAVFRSRFVLFLNGTAVSSLKASISKWAVFVFFK